MSAKRSVFEPSTSSLVTLPDGRQVSYDAVIREADRRRSEALAVMIRSLFGFGRPAAVAVPALHRQPRHA